MRRALALVFAGLAACAQVDPDVTVRHVGSNVPYGDGGRLHLFVFDPREPRPLAERKAIARASVAREARCAWIDAPDDVLIAETAKQGARYVDTLLVAPLRCRT